MAGANKPLQMADRGFFWVGTEHRKTEHGTVVYGQMFVQYEVPVEKKHPYPIVIVHGGGGQGLEYYVTPDGRPSWATHFLEAGYTVYVVDRPGLGRSPIHPDVLPMTGPIMMEVVTSLFASSVDSPGNPFAHLHTQWPGSGVLGEDPTLDQFISAQGPSIADQGLTHELMQSRGAELLDKIGPAIILTHSAGGPFGWLVADARPDLVKGILACEPGGNWGLAPSAAPTTQVSFSAPRPGAGGPPPGNPYGLASAPLKYDPPVNDPSEFELVTVEPTEEGYAPYRVQAEPARQLPNLKNIPVALITGEASFVRPRADGTEANLKQAGVSVEHIKLWEHGFSGNGHFFMGEKNNQEIADFLVAWLERNVEQS